MQSYNPTAAEISLFPFTSSSINKFIYLFDNFVLSAFCGALNQMGHVLSSANTIYLIPVHDFRPASTRGQIPESPGDRANFVLENASRIFFAHAFPPKSERGWRPPRLSGCSPGMLAFDETCSG